MTDIKRIKVKGVHKITLESPTPVLDLTAVTNGNFVLASGVVAHNSKDCSDANACSYFCLLKKEANFATVQSRVVGGNRRSQRMHNTGRNIRNQSVRNGGRLRSKLSNRRV